MTILLIFTQTPVVEEAEQMIFMIIKMMFLLGLIAVSIFLFVFWLGTNPSKRISTIFQKIKRTNKTSIIDSFIVT